MDWRPVASSAILRRRASMRAAVRDFFDARGVLEIEAPVLVTASCPDPQVPAIAVKPYGATVPRFLHTSPEHAMKRLLCAGSGDIYYLGPVFRDGEHGRVHNPEFTMIEWYRLGYDHLALAAETVDLLRTLLGEAGGSLRLERRRYASLFREHTGLEPHAVSRAQLAQACADRDIAAPGAATARDLIALLFATVVAPALSGTITIVHDYPADQAALARVRPGEPPVAERFEVFVDGLELANGFHELADAAEQRRRFVAERERHLATGRPAPPLDERLLAALEQGLPDCAGVALGFDRAVLLASGAARLADVLAFPYERS